MAEKGIDPIAISIVGDYSHDSTIKSGAESRQTDPIENETSRPQQLLRLRDRIRHPIVQIQPTNEAGERVRPSGVPLPWN